MFARLTLQLYLNLFVSQEQLRTKLYFEQGLKKGDERPAYTHNGVGLWLTFYRLRHSTQILPGIQISLRTGPGAPLDADQQCQSTEIQI